MGERVGKRVGISEEVIISASSLAVESHKSDIYKKENHKDNKSTIFAFAGSWSVQDFYAHEPFGETKINVSMFPSVRSIGNNELAMINEAFFNRFQAILLSKSFQTEVQKAIKKDKLIVFTGHTSGGPLAILCAIWYHENYTRSGKHPCKCITFGSPLVGDRIFTHALNRENWSSHFVHFVGRYDIIPRIMLSPLSSIRTEFSQILDLLNPRSKKRRNPTSSITHEASDFFVNVLMNAASVASHVGSNLMKNTNPLMETISSFVKLSPYRPSGTYIFCTGNGKLVSSSNANAVLQILFYCCQPAGEAEVMDATNRSLHMDYNSELKESLVGMQDVVYLDDQTDIPLSSNSPISGDAAAINVALNDLGLSMTARLCLGAAQQYEKEKLENQNKLDSKKPKIKEWHDLIAKYQNDCKANKIGYYDAFKIQENDHDFNANVTRLQLAGFWDEVVEMLKRYELPDGFEILDEWVKLGTEFRRLVEPLDIANYYRHSKDEDTGKYLKDGIRPKRYRYTQRWLEHVKKMKEGSSSESTFWAKVEEMRRKPFDEIREQIVVFEKEVDEWVQIKERDEWVQKEVLGEDVFFRDSTFAKWWNTLPENHRSESCLKSSFEMFAH